MNEDRKLAFINDCYCGKIDRYVSVFKSLCDCEAFYNKDLCELSEEQILPFLNEILVNTYATNTTKISILNKYYKYCYKNGFPNALNTQIVFSYHGDNCEGIINSMVSSPEELNNILNEIFADVQEGEFSNILRTGCWLLYSGLELEEAINVRVQDVNLDKGCIIYNGITYPIYNNSIDVVRFCIDNSEIYVKVTNRKYKKKRIESDLLLRSFSEINTKKIRDSIGKHVKHANEDGRCNKKLTCRSIYKSGLFFRAYNRNDNSSSIDVKPFEKCITAPKFADRVAYQHNRDLKIEYTKWKKCFYGKEEF